jgi:hypothetical protein
VKQALHIFRKDVSRFWPQCVVVSFLFAIYGMARRQQTDQGPSPPPVLAALIAIGCWLLIASLLHEDSPAEACPFWITRPYSRMSLLSAKLLFISVFIFLPLLVSDVLIEVHSGVNVSATAGTLLLFDLGIALWLILPALAIGGVTTSLKMFAGMTIALFAAFYLVTDLMFRHLDISALASPADMINLVSALPMVLAAIGAVWLQYRARKTQWIRASLIVAVILSASLIPLNGTASLSTRILNPGFDPDRIHISFDDTQPPRLDYTFSGRGLCFSLAVKVEGLPPGTVLREFGQTSGEVRSAMAGPREILRSIFEETIDGYRDLVCIPNSTAAPEQLRDSVSLTVMSVTPIAIMPARAGILVAGNSGRCEVVTPFPEDTQLRCGLQEPLRGSLVAGLEYPGYRVYASSRLLNSHGGSVPLSPMSFDKFDGTSFTAPNGWQFEFDEALARPDAHFVLRNERPVGAIRRDLVYRELVFPWSKK